MNAILVRAQKINTHLFVYATVLVAFFLRVYRLADKNIWWDEGWSLWLARQDFVAIALRTAADEHPPLHYWMLRAWDSLAGWDVFSARFLSVAFGVLTVGLVYRIGKRVGGNWIGALAALLLATARFHIWWSQDIKNYTPSIFFAFAAVWFGLELIADSQWQVANSSIRRSRLAIRNSVIAYSICAALAMLTHYLAALVLLALNLYWLFVLLRQSSRFSFSLWLVGNAFAAILFAPWLALYLQNAQAWSAAPAFDFGLFLKLIATALPLGVTTNIDDYAGLTIGFTTLAVLGGITVFSKLSTVNGGPWTVDSRPSTVTSSRGPKTDQRLLFIIVLLPPVLIYLLSLTPVSFFAPKIQARYLLILYPAYAILIALGIALLRKFSMYLALAATLFVLAASAIVLRDYYAERRLTDEYATLANEINSFARQGDLVLLDTDQEWPTFLYYLRAPLEWMGVPNGAAMTDSDADLLVRRALNRHSAVWLVAIPDALATDPQKMLQARLARELPKRLEQTFGDKRVELYARDERDLVQVHPLNLRIHHPLPPIPFLEPSVPIEYQVELIGFDLPIHEARAGDSIYVTTYWNAVARHGEMRLIIPVIPFIRERQTNIRSFPLELPNGKNIRLVTEVKIPATITPGKYMLQVAVEYGGVNLGEIIVESRGDIEKAEKISNRLDYLFGDSIHLVGYDLPQMKFHAGESIPITLYWRTDPLIEKTYKVFVHLVGAELNPERDNRLWGQVDQIPRDGSYPTNAWRPDEIVTDMYRVPIDRAAPSGFYVIEIGMYDPITGTRLALREQSDSVIIRQIQIVP